MAALVQPKQGWSSLDRSLWETYSLGRRMGLSDLGTYNPTSTLPGGGPSDHARSPALAFDLGFWPPVGQAHPLARTFYEAMIGRADVNYVILGDGIWSRSQGRHRYTAGGHQNHVHVSGVSGLTRNDPRAPTSSSTLSGSELASLWIAEGGNPRQASMAAAVALRESRGRARARNVTPKEDSRGLWQVNVRAHPQYLLRDLFDPRTNARAAISISRNGTDWSPWTTAAAARADVAQRDPRAVERPGGDGGVIPGLGGVLGGIGGAAGDVLGGVTGLVKPLWQWGEALVAFVAFVVNPLNWLRLVEVVVGFTLMLSGIVSLVVLFAKSDSGVGRVARGAASLTPVGRVGAVLRRGAGG